MIGTDGDENLSELCERHKLINVILDHQIKFNKDGITENSCTKIKVENGASRGVCYQQRWV